MYFEDVNDKAFIVGIFSWINKVCACTHVCRQYKACYSVSGSDVKAEVTQLNYLLSDANKSTTADKD